MSKTKIISILALWTLVVQLFVNIDSPLFTSAGHFDSAVFYQCGKAMMNGMIPYTEFADSKGPLLWLLFGIGHLMCNSSYYGVFVLMCMSIIVTLLIGYMTSRLWLSQKLSLIASISMVVPLFYWNFYTETKAEHFCWPFVAWAMFVMLKRYRMAETLQSYHYVILGFSFTCCLMMKWSIAVMMGSILVTLLCIEWKEKKQLSYLCNVACGILVGLFPWTIYFIVVGNFDDFVQEYFINTMASVQIPLEETISIYSGELFGVLSTKRVIYILYILPLLALWKRKQWFFSSLPFLCGCFFIALSVRHDNFGHYISVSSPFCIIAITWILKQVSEREIKMSYYLAAMVGMLTYIGWGTYKYKYIGNHEANIEYTRISNMYSQINNPKVLYLGQDPGWALGTSLPACRYWITQMGRTENMRKSQIHDMLSGCADIIAIRSNEENKLYTKQLLDIGYKQVEESESLHIYIKK